MDLRDELEKLMKELVKHKSAMVECGDMAEALYNILDDAPAEDVISDLGLDDMQPGV